MSVSLLHDSSLSLYLKVAVSFPDILMLAFFADVGTPETPSITAVGAVMSTAHV